MNMYQIFLYSIGAIFVSVWGITLCKLFIVDTFRHYHRRFYMKKHGFQYGIDKLSGYYNIELWGYTRGEESVGEQEVDQMKFHTLRKRYN